MLIDLKYSRKTCLEMRRGLDVFSRCACNSQFFHYGHIPLSVPSHKNAYLKQVIYKINLQKHFM